MKSTVITLTCSLLLLAGCSAQMSIQPTGPSGPQSGNTTTNTLPASTMPSTPSSSSPASSTPASSVPIAVPGIPQEGLVTKMSFQSPLSDLTLLNGYEGSGLSKVSDRFGRPDQALAFSGEESFLKLNAININPEIMPKVSMSIWARYTGSDTENSFMVISHDDGQYDRSLGLDKRTGEWGWSMFTGNSENFIIGGASVEAGTWVFLTATYDQVNHHSALYINGQKYKEGPNTSGDGFPYLMLGGNPGYGQNFTGEMDDFYLYKRVLSDAEVKQIYDITKLMPQ